MHLQHTHAGPYCCCAGRKRYADALRLLLYAITAPTFVVNAITMAAHKKYVLVSLIHTGLERLLAQFALVADQPFSAACSACMLSII